MRILRRLSRSDILISARQMYRNRETAS